MTHEEQKKEIETVRPWKFEVNFSTADVERLFKKAYSNGITPEVLISSYIGDLVGGTYTNGSDERDLAEKYFERCGYDFIPKSFLSWALNELLLDELQDALKKLDFVKDDLEYLEEDKKTMLPQEYEEEKRSLKEIENEANEDIKKIYANYRTYKEEKKEKPQEVEAGIEEVRQYLKRLEAVKEDGFISKVSEKLEKQPKQDKKNKKKACRR